MALSGSLSLAVHSGFPLDLHAKVNRCIAHAEQVELRHRLPLGLLRAIALVESGWSLTVAEFHSRGRGQSGLAAKVASLLPNPLLSISSRRFRRPANGTSTCYLRQVAGDHRPDR